MIDLPGLKKLCQLIRYDILTSTTAAGSGHPTSSLSAVELAVTLFFAGFFKYDLKNPKNPANDRFILSKGHASPLLYSLYHAAGAITYEELLTLRSFNSVLEGHPTPRFKYVDVATGSLGQGLSIGVGMALGMKLNKKQTIDDRGSKLDLESRSLKLDNQSSAFQPQNPASSFKHPASRVWVLLGDSEMAEGQIWEAMEIASYYKLDNLIGIIDVNRLGQRGETMLAWDLQTYAKRAEAFGWETIIVEDGNNLEKIYNAFKKLTIDDRGLKVDIEDRKSKVEKNYPPSNFYSQNPSSIIHSPSSNNYKPKMIIAKTIKGKGVSFLENKNGWHGKALTKEHLQEALTELGNVDLNIRGTVNKPNYQLPNKFQIPNKKNHELRTINYELSSLIATREAYGDALVALGEIDSRIVVLDAEVSNSTFAEKFAKKFPDRYFEMFIAEQNMVSTGLGLSKQGYIPFVSSFAAFLTRAFDQIRMSQYSSSQKIVKNSYKSLKINTISNYLEQFKTSCNLKFVGSHAGVSIGSDGPSQMGLEDLAMMRSVLNSVVFYPCDAVSSFKLTKIMAQNSGLFYLRTTREKTPVIYKADEDFKIGGSKILRQSAKDVAVVFAAGVTVHEALKAYDVLKNEQISIAVVDVYSIKPIDEKTVQRLVEKCKNVMVVEDHYPYGGLGEAILSCLSSNAQKQKNWKFTHLCVHKLPHSGTPAELLRYEEIDAKAIENTVKARLKKSA